LARHHDVATVSAHFVFTFGAVDDVWQAAEEKQSNSRIGRRRLRPPSSCHADEFLRRAGDLPEREITAVITPRVRTVADLSLPREQLLSLPGWPGPPLVQCLELEDRYLLWDSRSGCSSPCFRGY